MIKNRIDLITLGCSKNLVDSERLMGQLAACGYKMHHDPEDPKGEIVIVNTCGFIGDAKEESINTILGLTELKKKRKIGQIFVMGCLSERYRKELLEEIPEIDRIYGKYDWKQILSDLGHSWDDKLRGHRIQTSPRHYAYVKISEGCNRMCAYCAIPIITGKYKSRAIEDIISEVENLVSNGVREIQLIAQDLTGYGIDRYGRYCIAELVEKIAKVPGVDWLRLHYAYPNDFPLELLDVMNRYPNICKYLDIALQHSADHVLSKMLRKITRQETVNLLAEIRKRVPGIHLRTTLMVGFCDETEEDFNDLCEFVKTERFERMGAFAFCEEEGTYAALHYKDNIDSEVKQQRLDTIMALQQEISNDIQQQKVGQTMNVIIDRLDGEYYVARTEFDSPEVDPEVLIAVDSLPTTQSGFDDNSFVPIDLKIGDFYKVRIIEASPYELYATLE
ncbi:MAG: 30S ribosomal protein S12 methylthiotransferase RimO [Bacteroidales bacterium]|nr:30S ribosomal protein S12 methylthiotransferase RimO [Candidatus Liminaster caballi]